MKARQLGIGHPDRQGHRGHRQARGEILGQIGALIVPQVVQARRDTPDQSEECSVHNESLTFVAG